MTPEDIKAIIAERLGRWAAHLAREHSTPVVLVGVGHDHKRGQTLVLTTEQMTDNEVMLFLAGALRDLAEQRGQRN